MEGSAPAGFIEEVDDDVYDEAYAVADRGLVDLVFGGDERPVDEERTAYDVFSWHETPVAAVEANRTVVAHGEVVAGRNNEVFSFNMCWQIDGPLRGYVGRL